MAQAIEMALIQVYATIPYEILVPVFEPHRRGMALDHCIYQDIIQSRVLKECNLYAGKMTSIPLLAEYVEETNVSNYHAFPFNTLYAIFRIPPHMREHKSLTHVISVEFPNNYFNTSPYGVYGMSDGNGRCSSVNMSSLACQALAGAAGVLGGINGPYGTPKPIPQLLAGDLVKLTPTASLPLPGFAWMLTCRLEYDSELTNLNASAVKPFTNLVEHATKAYIYNHAILKIDKFYTDGGMELGRFREVIDSYSDQEEKYREAFQIFRYTSIVHDTENKKKFIYWML